MATLLGLSARAANEIVYAAPERTPKPLCESCACQPSSPTVDTVIRAKAPSIGSMPYDTDPRAGPLNSPFHSDAEEVLTCTRPGGTKMPSALLNASWLP